MSISPISDVVDSIKRSLEASQLGPIIHCDVSGENDSCGAKLEAVIVCAKFEGMPLLQRQKAVHEIVRNTIEVRQFFILSFTILQLKAQMQRVHAFSMKTWTPTEAEKKLEKSSTICPK
jgi:acid stress-induced BolA-like protein IbaG/YrbA